MWLFCASAKISWKLFLLLKKRTQRKIVDGDKWKNSSVALFFYHTPSILMNKVHVYFKILL
jgi:hypothetical protein